MKQKTFRIILIAVILSLAFNVLFGRWLSAQISTWPLLNRLKLLSPQAPIVITNREEIRISDGTDVLQAIQDAKSKISVIATFDKGQMTLVAGAVNLTGEGMFVTAGVNLVPNQDYYVVLNDGRTAKIIKQILDPATGLVFLTASINNVPTAALGNSTDVKPGEKILFLVNSSQSSLTKYAQGFVVSSQNDIVKKIFDADRPSRGFSAQATSTLMLGQAVVTTNAQVVGMWDGSKIISSDVLKKAVSLYFENNAKISRPQFGFSYEIVTKTESLLINLPEGARVTSIVKLSPAQTAGLQIGDIITSVDNIKINETSVLEEVLQRYKPGDSINLIVLRGGNAVNLTLKVGELK